MIAPLRRVPCMRVDAHPYACAAQPIRFHAMRPSARMRVDEPAARLIPLVHAPVFGEPVEQCPPAAGRPRLHAGRRDRHRADPVRPADRVQCGEPVVRLRAGLADPEQDARPARLDHGPHDAARERSGIVPQAPVDTVRVHDDHVAHGPQSDDRFQVVVGHVPGMRVGGSGEQREHAARVPGPDERGLQSVDERVFQRLRIGDVQPGALGLLSGVAVDERGAQPGGAERVGEHAGGGAFADAAGSAGHERDSRLSHGGRLCAPETRFFARKNDPSP
ncbi:hypothetical protein I118_1119 [Bifidobacterium longum D2957]|nr:hypothetical protein I118_1119 [Bifidobacterium longum D2957]